MSPLWDFIRKKKVKKCNSCCCSFKVQKIQGIGRTVGLGYNENGSRTFQKIFHVTFLLYC
ncbi:unnamed protein product [Larinioides sclopetarius]|uniref:Uncharacterized protein n=1 Tax=Larinioides sclopetarius TaxID=280406 RepID=A0AAV2AG91_9ARAC